MTGNEPSAEDLKRRQIEQEQAEREGLKQAETPAQAERHRRRADKAGYLREKLEERQRAEREDDGDFDPPAAA